MYKWIFYICIGYDCVVFTAYVKGTDVGKTHSPYQVTEFLCSLSTYILQVFLKFLTETARQQVELAGRESSL